ALADQEFSKSSSLLPLRNKVFALLRLRRYGEAARLCEEIIRLRSGEVDSDFIFFGVSRWMDERYGDALNAWQTASDTKFTDAAGGVQIWLLTLFGAIKLGDTALGKRAETKLKKKLSKRAAIANWPGPIARFAVGESTVEELLAAVDAEPTLRARELCQAEFY